MKKLFIIALSAALFASCSKGGEVAPTKPTDPTTTGASYVEAKYPIATRLVVTYRGKTDTTAFTGSLKYAYDYKAGEAMSIRLLASSGQGSAFIYLKGVSQGGAFWANTFATYTKTF